MELLKITKVEKELRIVKREGLLNIQLLVIGSLPHSSSMLECVKGKVYNKNIQFTQMIIQDINTTKPFVIEIFAHKKKMLASKKTNKTKNYINRSDVH
jgi:mannosyltransferase OCH1-like enzyme